MAGSGRNHKIGLVEESKGSWTGGPVSRLWTGLGTLPQVWPSAVLCQESLSG